MNEIFFIIGGTIGLSLAITGIIFIHKDPLDLFTEQKSNRSEKQ